MTKIFLNRPLKPGKTTEIEIEFGYLEFLVPHVPADCKQIYEYTGNLYFYSMFKALKETTTVIVPPNNIVSYTKAHPVSQSNHTILYGPYKNVPSFAIENFQVIKLYIYIVVG